MQYVLMNKNTPVLTCEIDEDSKAISKVTDLLNPAYLPVGIGVDKKHLRKDLNDWWRGRSIPASRQGLTEALSEMGLADKDDLLTKGLGLSLSDQYWFNPNDKFSWEKVNFFHNPFSEEVGDILFGSKVSTEQQELDLASPDNTSDGWLKKRWKIINGKRCLIKGGSGTVMQEPINEAFVSKVMEKLGFDNFVPYELKIIDGKPYSVCEDFITPDTELVTAQQILSTAKKSNNISWYTHLLNCCEAQGIKGAREHVDFLLSLDYLIVNEDRHTNNFGVIRNVNTLEFVGMAPVFDNGTSLWCNTFEDAISPLPKYKAKPFYESPAKQLELVSSFDGFDLTKLDGVEAEFNTLLSRSPTVSEGRRNILCRCFSHRKEDFQLIP